MTNPFTSRNTPLSGPGTDYVPVSPNDGTDLADVAVSLYVESGGAVVFDSVKGGTRTVTVPNFGYVLCGGRRVRSTGTSASGIHAVVIAGPSGLLLHPGRPVWSRRGARSPDLRT